MTDIWKPLWSKKTMTKITKTHTQTYNEGANDERDAVLARLRRRVNHFYAFRPLYAEVEVELSRNVAWLLARAKRYGKRKGGLGR